MNSNILGGYRGYIGSRDYQCGNFPQSMQNMLIRNYCQQHQLTYLLSATEYAIPGCYMMLQEVIRSLDVLEGFVLFSIHLLPESKEARIRIYEKILSHGKTMHAALENLSIKSSHDISKIESILHLNHIVLSDEAIQHLCLNLGSVDNSSSEIKIYPEVTRSSRGTSGGPRNITCQ